MRPIQYLLLVLLAAGVAFYFTRLRSRVADRLLATALTLAATLGILFPDLATEIAHTVGVGRGVDLVMYISLFTLGYLWVLLYARERQTQHKLTKLVRALAIANARAANETSQVRKAA